jgi:hypothetical protein
MTEKRKVGRPKKTSTVAKPQKEIKMTWKSAYLNLVQEEKKRNEMFEAFKSNASSVIGEMADTQLNTINLFLSSIDDIENHCVSVLETTKQIDITDVSYMVNLAKRKLLATYSQFENTEE